MTCSLPRRLKEGAKTGDTSGSDENSICLKQMREALWDQAVLGASGGKAGPACGNDIGGTMVWRKGYDKRVLDCRELPLVGGSRSIEVFRRGSGLGHGYTCRRQAV